MIVLVGISGAGKTTVGRILAEHLNWQFIDLDERIEQTAGASVAEIFRSGGEAEFRAMERRLTGGLSSVRHAVVAPGGGWIANAGAREALPSDARLVWLRVSPEEAVRRVAGSGVARPLLEGDPLGSIRRLLEARAPLYASADLTVDVDGRTAERIAHEILVSLEIEAHGQ